MMKHGGHRAGGPLRAGGGMKRGPKPKTSNNMNLIPTTSTPGPQKLSTRFTALEEEMELCQQKYDSLSYEHSILLAEINIVTNWIHEQFGIQLINQSSPIFKYLHMTDGVQDLSVKLSMPKLATENRRVCVEDVQRSVMVNQEISNGNGRSQSSMNHNANNGSEMNGEDEYYQRLFNAPSGPQHLTPDVQLELEGEEEEEEEEEEQGEEEGLGPDKSASLKQLTLLTSPPLFENVMDASSNDDYGPSSPHLKILSITSLKKGEYDEKEFKKNTPTPPTQVEGSSTSTSMEVVPIMPKLPPLISSPVIASMSKLNRSTGSKIVKNSSISSSASARVHHKFPPVVQRIRNKAISKAPIIRVPAKTPTKVGESTPTKTTLTPPTRTPALAPAPEIKPELTPAASSNSTTTTTTPESGIRSRTRGVLKVPLRYRFEEEESPSGPPKIKRTISTTAATQAPAPTPVQRKKLTNWNRTKILLQKQKQKFQLKQPPFPPPPQINLHPTQQPSTSSSDSPPMIAQRSSSVTPTTNLPKRKSNLTPSDLTCHHCSKIFSSKWALTTHYRVHTGEKPFPCSYCEQRFAYNQSKQLHERHMHTGEKPFQCYICHKAYCSTGELNTHLARAHKQSREGQGGRMGQEVEQQQHLVFFENRNGGGGGGDERLLMMGEEDDEVGIGNQEEDDDEYGSHFLCY